MKRLFGLVPAIGLLIALVSCGGGGSGALPSITSFTATPNSISSGETSTLSWNVRGQQTLTIDPGIGSVTGQNSITINPTQTTTYTLTASNSIGVDTATVEVTVTPPGGDRPPDWIRQFGSDDDDIGNGVAVDGSGNAYITGWTNGSLDGSNAGGTDVFLAKYASDGNQQWIQQFGSADDDLGYGVAVDGSGNAYITGHTLGSLDGSNAGGLDVFLAKYDSDGNQQWIRQFGSADYDQGWGVAVDGSGNAYITGWTTGSLNGSNAGGYDVFLAKYASDGTQQWIQQFGSGVEDLAKGVAVDGSGNAYITGWTNGSLTGSNAGDADVFLAKYASDGTQQWIRQFGSAESDSGTGIGVDGSGNAYITGSTGGSLDGSTAGGTDVFLAKYASDGTQQWIHQFGSDKDDEGTGIAVDGSGNAYITGTTGGSLNGSNAGPDDVFLAKHGSDGNQQWIRQFGSADDDQGRGVAVDGSGNAYITGTTRGSLDGSNAGSYDVFLAKYSQ